MTNGKGLLDALLNRGDVISISKGCLNIKPASGKAVPKQWEKDRRDGLLEEIILLTGVNGFMYESYSTGRYGHKRFSGVTLQFRSLQSGEQSFVIFNAELDRSKNTSKGKKGTPLPKGNFRVRINHGFYKFWRKTKLPVPRSLSSFHDCMGKLKPLVFVGNYIAGEKLNKKSLKPLNLSYQEILQAMKLKEPSNISHTNTIGQPNKNHTVLPYKRLDKDELAQGIGGDSATGENNYGERLKGNAVTRDTEIPMSAPKGPEAWTEEEWYDDYERELNYLSDKSR